MLPKLYEDPNGNYPHMKGKPKLSYSAYSSFIEDGYRGEFFSNYFLGVRGDGNIFTKFGSLCGTFFELHECEELNHTDREIIKTIERHPEAKYESEIVIDRGWYCIQGFSDREIYNDKKVRVEDLKTGAISSKKAFYAGDKYQQTTIYAYQRENEGFEVDYSGVILLDRKGNGNASHPLRLTGQIEYIPTPYSRERAENFLKEFDKTALEIKRYWEIFQKHLA